MGGSRHFACRNAPPPVAQVGTAAFGIIAVAAGLAEASTITASLVDIGECSSSSHPMQPTRVKARDGLAAPPTQTHKHAHHPTHRNHRSKSVVGRCDSALTQARLHSVADEVSTLSLSLSPPRRRPKTTHDATQHMPPMKTETCCVLPELATELLGKPEAVST